MSVPGSNSSKVARMLHYGDPKLDEEIVIPSYDLRTISIDQITKMQDARCIKQKKEARDTQE